MIRSKYFITLLFLLFVFGSCGGLSFGMKENENENEIKIKNENEYDNNVFRYISLDDSQHNVNSDEKIDLGTTSAECMKNKFYYNTERYYNDLRNNLLAKQKLENQKSEHMNKKSDNIKNKREYLINKNDEDTNKMFEQKKLETISALEKAVSNLNTIISKFESNLLTGYKQIKEYQKKIDAYKWGNNIEHKKYNLIIDRNNSLIKTVEGEGPKVQLNDNDYITGIIDYYAPDGSKKEFHTKIKTYYNTSLETISEKIKNMKREKIEDNESFGNFLNNLNELYDRYNSRTGEWLKCLYHFNVQISEQLQNLTNNFNLKYKEEPIPEVEVSILNPYYKNKETCSWGLHKDIIHNKKQILHHNKCKQSLKGIFTKDNRKKNYEEICKNLSENKNTQNNNTIQPNEYNNDTIKSGEYNNNMIKLVELVINNFEEISNNILPKYNDDNNDILQCINDYLYDENLNKDNNENDNNHKNFYQFLYCKANEVVQNQLKNNKEKLNKKGSRIISLFIAGMTSVNESDQDFINAKDKASSYLNTITQIYKEIKNVQDLQFNPTDLLKTLFLNTDKNTTLDKIIDGYILKSVEQIETIRSNTYYSPIKYVLVPWLVANIVAGIGGNNNTWKKILGSEKWYLYKSHLHLGIGVNYQIPITSGMFKDARINLHIIGLNGISFLCGVVCALLFNSDTNYSTSFKRTNTIGKKIFGLLVCMKTAFLIFGMKDKHDYICFHSEYKDGNKCYEHSGWNHILGEYAATFFVNSVQFLSIDLNICQYYSISINLGTMLVAFMLGMIIKNPIDIVYRDIADIDIYTTKNAKMNIHLGNNSNEYTNINQRIIHQKEGESPLGKNPGHNIGDQFLNKKLDNN